MSDMGETGARRQTTIRHGSECPIRSQFIDMILARYRAAPVRWPTPIWPAKGKANDKGEHDATKRN